MYLVSEFLDISAALGAEALERITSPNPRRDYQGGITGDTIVIQIPNAQVGEEIAILIERIQGGRVTGLRCASGPLRAIEEVSDLYLDRKRVLHRCVPEFTNMALHYRPDSAAMRIGTILAWRTADEIEISDDLIAVYPFSSGLTPRGISDTTEGGDEVLSLVGQEPTLTVSMSFFSPETAPPDPEEKFYKVMRALSPQKNFFFHGRNLSEAWIIGRSARRTARYVAEGYGKRRIQPVAMVAL